MALINTNPRYLMTIGVELRAAEDRKMFRAKLSEAAERDPAFDFQVDGPSGQFILKGMDEYHLDSLIGRIVGNANVEINLGAPQVAYRESISKIKRIDYPDNTRPKTNTPDVRFALIVEPMSCNEDYEVDGDIVAMPQNSQEAIYLGIKSALQTGPVAGFQVSGIRIKILDLDYPANNLSLLQTAMSDAVMDAIQQAEAQLFEPVVKIEIAMPVQQTADVIADLQSRRGQIISVETSDKIQTIYGTVPFSSLFGYRNILKHLTGSEAKYATSFSHYSPVTSPNTNPPKQPAVIMRA